LKVTDYSCTLQKHLFISFYTRASGKLHFYLIEILAMFISRPLNIFSVLILSSSFLVGGIEDAKQKQLNLDLYSAISNNNPNLVRELLEKGANAGDANSPDRHLPLYWALCCLQGAAKKEIAELLLMHGARPNLEDHLELILHTIRSTDRSEDVFFWSPLPQTNSWSCLNELGYIDTFELLLKYGINEQCSNVLLKAVGLNIKQIVLLLLEYGIDLCRDQLGEKCLSKAIAHNNAQLSKLLIAHGANFSNTYHNPHEAPHVMTFNKTGEFQRACAALIPPRALSCLLGNVDMLKQLWIDKSNTRFSKIKRVLSSVKKKFEKPIVRLAQLEMTPLHYAASQGHLVIVEFLLSKKVALSARNETFDTPADLAVRNGAYEVH
jgi:ankyrin repeat protein